MSKIEIPKKIRAEDFPSDDRELASRIGAVYNSFVDNLYFLLQKNIDFDNLNRELITITLTIDSSGKITNPPTVKHSLRTGAPRGVSCVGAVCLTNNLMYPITAPFVTITPLTTNTFTFANVTGLQANTQYSLVLELIG